MEWLAEDVFGTLFSMPTIAGAEKRGDAERVGARPGWALRAAGQRFARVCATDLRARFRREARDGSGAGQAQASRRRAAVSRVAVFFPVWLTMIQG